MGTTRDLTVLKTLFVFLVITLASWLFMEVLSGVTRKNRLKHSTSFSFKKCRTHGWDQHVKMGRFEYQQWQFILKHKARRIKCVGLYGNSTLHKWTGDDLQYVLNFYDDITYNVSALQIDVSGRFLSLVIHETIKGLKSLGGSNFRIEMRGEDNALCTAKDLLNGTYMVICPVVDTCVIVTVQLVYVNFDAFIFAKLAPINHVIHRTGWCPHATRPLVRDISKCCPTLSSSKDSLGRWWNSGNSSWEWHVNGCAVEPVSINRTMYCLNYVSSIHIIGDSHARYIVDYLLHVKTGRTPERPHRTENFNSSNIFFWWSTYTNVTADNIKTLRTFRNRHSSNNITRNDIVLISNGAWDTAYIGLDNFVQSFNDEIIPRLREFRRDPVWSKATIMFMNISPSPPQRRTVKAAGYRTNFGLAAINYWLDIRMQELGIHVIDAFNIIHLRNNENVCLNHYICYVKSPHGDRRVLQRGTVDYKAADVIVKMICEAAR